MGDAACLDDVRETGHARVVLPPAEVSRYGWAHVDTRLGATDALTPAYAQATRDWKALHDAERQLAQSAQTRSDVAERRARSLADAARAHLDAIDAHGPRSAEAREAAERLHGML